LSIDGPSNSQVQATVAGLLLSEALLTLTRFTQRLDRASVELGQHLLSSAGPIPSLCTFTFQLLLGTLLLLTLDVGALVMPGAFPI